MKWMEVIGVRTAAGNRGKLEAKLRSFVHEVQKTGPQNTIKVFHRFSLESDICFYIQHDTREIEVNGSRLGLRLTAEMKVFGLVHHSIWYEKPGINLDRELRKD